MLVTTWCDTPSSGDQIDFLVANNGGLYSRVDWTNENYNSYEPTARTLIIDGHTGSIAQYRIIADTSLYNATGSFDLRFKWLTTSSGALEGTGANTLSSYGCFVRDIQLDTSIAVGGYAYYAGTSMATPHVAGAAALAMSYRPTATLADVKNAIIWGGDWKQQLSDKIQYGGRLNILNMLEQLNPPALLKSKITNIGRDRVRIDTQVSDPGVTLAMNYSTYSGVWLSDTTDYARKI